ncbi:MAG: DUF4330 domain-containing protein [Oscillospiraceae bacterium]|nr:DUF4330 domain-containing protein [Oscillospiraceae bacterium]
MKAIDKNGRIFGKISVIDVIVVIVVVLLAAGIYLRYFALETTAAIGQPSEPIEFSLRVGGVRQYTVDVFAVGDEVFSGSNMEKLGTITNISVGPAMQWGATVDGRTLHGEIEDKYDMIVTVQGEGVISDGHFYVSRIQELGANQSASFFTKYSSFGGMVTEIKAL